MCDNKEDYNASRKDYCKAYYDEHRENELVRAREYFQKHKEDRREKNAANARRDIKDKYEIYAENGVSEYWLARPSEKTIEKFILDISTNKYQLEGYFALNDTISCSVLPELEISVNEIFE